MQQFNGNRKGNHGWNHHYFDLYLQVSGDKNHIIRVMTSGMDDTAKNQLFRDKQHAEQPVMITNLRVASSGMVFTHNKYSHQRYSHNVCSFQVCTTYSSASHKYS